jgi:2'-5' RNA ligase
MGIYDQLWAEAEEAFAGAGPQVDAHLADRARDQRRGVSLIFRPPPAVQARIKDFLDPLAEEFPGQHFYAPAEFHVTVLTPISGTERWRRDMRELRVFREILREALRGQPAFGVEFCGVTAAPNAVMVQGFPRDGGLEQIRAGLRRAFAERGLGGRLDRRYRNAAAHITVMRFSRAGADGRRLLARLEANRDREFGAMPVDTLQLVWSDWYASAKGLRVLEEFPLGRPALAA